MKALEVNRYLNLVIRLKETFKLANRKIMKSLAKNKTDLIGCQRELYMYQLLCKHKIDHKIKVEFRSIDLTLIGIA